MSALDKALAFSDATYMRAKSARATVEALVASTRAGAPWGNIADMSKAENQLKAFKSWPYAAIRVIAQKIAAQKVCVGRVKSRRSMRSKSVAPEIEELPAHPLLDVLADPNELGTSWSLMYVTVASLLLCGKSFWYMPIIGGRQFIYPLPPSWVVGFRGSTSYDTWLVRPPHHGEPEEIDSSELVYFPLPNPHDPHEVMSPLMAAALAVEADEHVQQSQRSMFARGIFPSHAVIVGQTIGADGKPTGRRPTLTGAQHKQIVDAVMKSYSSVFKSGQPLILDGMIERIEKLSMGPDEMDWTESAKALKSRILEAFGVNAIVLGQIEGANRASSLEAERHLATYTLNPLIDCMSAVMTQWLPPMWAESPKALRVWIDPVVPRDEQSEHQRVSLACQFGALTVDELRNYAGFDPLASGGEEMIGASDGMEAALNRGMDRRLGALAGEMVNRNFLGNREPTKGTPAAGTQWRQRNGTRVNGQPVGS